MTRFIARFPVLCFLLILCTPVLAQVPEPVAVFGFKPGADYKLANYEQMLDYYTQLAQSSKRVKLIEIGRSVQNRPLLLLFISSEKNLKQLENWRSISEQLSRARITDQEARQLAQKGKAIVWIDGGLHASELACAQMTPELAWRIATEETAEMQQIRDNVITLLMPVMNPDGLDIVSSWYQGMLGTPYEGINPPWLWHPYIGHDNNRDWFMNNMPESKAVSRVLYNQWYPQIVYNHHQSAPSGTRIFIPPFSNPVNPNIHPGITTSVDLIGAAMANRFAMEHMPGAISRVSYDMWWDGGMRSVPYYHNQVGILTETAHPSPSPRRYSARKSISNISADGTDISYPYPWEGGESHFRDAVDYMLTASMAVLNLAAERKEQFLYNIYRMGQDAISDSTHPYAYIFPPHQWDEGEALQLLNILETGGIEIEQSTAAFSANGKNYPASTYLVHGAQAFRPYITDMLEKQVYPDQRQYPGGPPDKPYDLTGWTLPLQMGVTLDRVNQPFEVSTRPVTTLVAAHTNPIDAASYGYAILHQEKAVVQLTNRLLKQQVPVNVTEQPFTTGGQLLPAGTFIVSTTDTALLHQLAGGLSVHLQPLETKPLVAMHALHPVRIGLYKSWRANMDEGWTRWLLEQYEFTIDTLHNKDLLQKDLSQYQAILLPDQSEDQLLNGYRKGSMPDAFTGGIELQGALALKNYVEAGGTLIALDAATDFAIRQLGLPVSNAVEGLSSDDFYIPGSLLRLQTDTSLDMAYGMQPVTAASFNRSRAFNVPSKDSTVTVVARYASKDLLMSGWALHEERIAGKAAVVNITQGKGRVLLFAFPPQFRGQPHGTYPLLFNALIQ